MEVASSAISLFNVAIDCFGRIQLARVFEDDFATYQLKLDVIQIRLSRWGELAKINAAVVGAKRDEQADAWKVAAKLLSDIHDTFASAQRNAKRVKAKLAADSDQTLDPESCMPSDLKKIRKRLHDCLGRRMARAVKGVEGIKWAFYKRDHFEKFVVDISALVDALEHIFPEDTRQTLRELSNEECKGISKPNLEELKEIIKDCDPWLDAAVDEELEHVPGGSYYITQSHNKGSMVTGIHNGNVNGVSNGNNNKTDNYWGLTGSQSRRNCV